MAELNSGAAEITLPDGSKVPIDAADRELLTKAVTIAKTARRDNLGAGKRKKEEQKTVGQALEEAEAEAAGPGTGA